MTEARPRLPESLTRYGERVQAEFGSALPNGPPNGSMELAGPFRYHLGWADRQGNHLERPTEQGKGLRPSLCLFACQALEGNWVMATPAAVSLELIHNFSLVHDDIQDGDEERRHRPTVWRLWGEPKALLVGDAMHAIAYQAASRLARRGVPEAKALRCSRLLVESCLAMIKGQVQDLRHEDDLDAGLESYLEMIRLKTGALIQCALEIGALLATDDAGRVAAFARFGHHLGRVFQIRDDVLGIWGNEARTGKAGKGSGNDIRRRKKSLPIVLAFETAGGRRRGQLASIYRKESLNREDVDRVMELLDVLETRRRAQELIEAEAVLALKSLEAARLSAWARGEADSLVEFLVTREH